MVQEKFNVPSALICSKCAPRSDVCLDCKSALVCSLCNLAFCGQCRGSKFKYFERGHHICSEECLERFMSKRRRLDEEEEGEDEDEEGKE